MIEKALDTFIQILINYFQTTYKIEIDIGTPYLIDDLSELSGDYAGIIDISGDYEGSCYFSTPQTLLQQIIKSLSIDVDSESDVVLSDIAGEIANTLSGNARAELGENFNISIPKVFKGKNALEAVGLQTRTYAIPVKWGNEKAFLGVSLK